MCIIIIPPEPNPDPDPLPVKQWRREEAADLMNPITHRDPINRVRTSLKTLILVSSLIAVPMKTRYTLVGNSTRLYIRVKELAAALAE